MDLGVLLCLVAALIQLSCARHISDDEAAAWKQLTRYFTIDEIKQSESFPLVAARKFGSDVIVDCNGTYKIVDVDKLKLVPLSIQNARAIHSIYDDDRRLYALCSVPQGVRLKVKDEAQWREMDVPAPVVAKPKDWSIIAGDGEIVLISEGLCFSWQKSHWQKIVLKGDVTFRPGNKLVMKAGKIYSAFDLGEWGGRIVEIDCQSGASQTIFENSMYPVTDLKFGSNGQLWFVCGCAHMMWQSAALYSYDGELHCLSEVQGIRSSIINSLSPPSILSSLQKLTGKSAIRRSNWAWEPTSFAGLVFDNDGSLLISTLDYGLLRYSKGQWSGLTQTWKEGVPVCGLVLTKSDTAVLPVYDRGIVLYDLKKGDYKFILPEYCKRVPGAERR